MAAVKDCSTGRCIKSRGMSVMVIETVKENKEK